ncbi:hypothetical protein L1049_008402 [Liquidambar formosana]|uniref:Uncharacterized protein n=1 Tax=Liquidambar formosana TaxID=63359 RepID=A0AAP0S3L0_LIQFO
MAQKPSFTPVASPVPVISPLFCTPHPVDLAMNKKCGLCPVLFPNFVVKDVNGNIVFKVKHGPVQMSYYASSTQRVIFDAAGNCIITLRRQALSARWEGFRGDITKAKDLLFTANITSRAKAKRLDVFLASNTAQEVCDFNVKGSFWGGSCVIYAGESSTIVAEMRMKCSVRTCLGYGKYMVTVHPNMDYAFIVALIMIVETLYD